MGDFILPKILKDINLNKLIIKDFPRIAANCSVGDAMNFLRNNGVYQAAVVDGDNRLLGVIDSNEFLGVLFEENKNKFNPLTSIDSLIKEPEKVITEGNESNFNLKSILYSEIQSVMVVDKGNRLIGAIISNDGVNAFWKDICEVAEVFGSVLDSVYNGVVVINENGNIIFTNSSAEEIVGYQNEELLGKHIHAIIPDSNLFEVVKTGIPQLAIRQKIEDRVVITNRTPVRLNGKIVGAVAVFQDVTDFESISEELNNTIKLNAAMETVIDNPYEGLVVVDENSRIIMINKFYSDAVGVTSEEAVGKHIHEITPHSQLPDTVRTGVAQIGSHWKVNGQEFIIMRIPIKKDGKIIGALGKTLFKDMELARVFAKRLIQLENDLDFYKEELRKVHATKYTFENIIGQSEKIKGAKNLAKRASRTSSTVLITGESGTGKEVFAHAIHNAGSRKLGPFVKINCAAIPEHLLESELFGYAEGAFTGARKGGKPGKFEIANNGTIFLDEIGDMSLTMQAKLLRVIQEQEIERVGGTKTFKVNVRIIAATNRKLLKMVEEKIFREDLYYRLNVIELELPPLRERIEDIELLSSNLISKLNLKLGTYIEGLSDEVLIILKQYYWPGNIRELENILERSMNISDEGFILPEHLPVHLRRSIGKGHIGQKTMEQALLEAEQEVIYNALSLCKGNKVKAAEALGIHRSVLYKKLAKYNSVSE